MHDYTFLPMTLLYLMFLKKNSNSFKYLSLVNNNITVWSCIFPNNFDADFFICFSYNCMNGIECVCMCLHFLDYPNITD